MRLITGLQTWRSLLQHLCVGKVHFLCGIFLLLCCENALAGVAKIHLHREDGNYTAWGIHTWGDGVAATEWKKPTKAVGSDDFGAIFEVEFEPGTDKFGFILHRGNTKNNNVDLFYQPSVHGNEVWILQGDTAIYTKNPLITPPVASKPIPVVSTPVKVTLPKNIEKLEQEQAAKALAIAQKMREQQLQLELEQQKILLEKEQIQKKILEAELRKKEELMNKASTAEPIVASAVEEQPDVVSSNPIATNPPVENVSIAVEASRIEAASVVVNTAPNPSPIAKKSFFAKWWWLSFPLLGLFILLFFIWRKTNALKIEAENAYSMSSLDADLIPLDRTSTIMDQLHDLAGSAVHVGGVSVVAVSVPKVDLMRLKSLSDDLTTELRPSVVVLSSTLMSDPVIVVTVSPEVQDFFKASDLMTHLSQQVGGKASGRNRAAHNIGGDTRLVAAALKSVEPWVRKRVESMPTD